MAKNVETKPAEAGGDPNINAIIKISTLLPVDYLYWPTLMCTVYDYAFAGLS